MYPPVDTVFYHPADVAPESHFLIVSALVPYKRIDLAIAACEQIGAPLRIAGDGPDRARLARRAGPGVTFLGWLSNEEIRDEYRRAAAVILPGEEDFGLVPLEAQACGCPVVALGARGRRGDGQGRRDRAFFSTNRPSPSLTAALERVRAIPFDRSRLRLHAEQFARERHIQRMRAVIDETLAAPAGTRW